MCQNVDPDIHGFSAPMCANCALENQLARTNVHDLIVDAVADAIAAYHAVDIYTLNAAGPDLEDAIDMLSEVLILVEAAGQLLSLKLALVLPPADPPARIA